MKTKAEKKANKAKKALKKLYKKKSEKPLSPSLIKLHTLKKSDFSSHTQENNISENSTKHAFKELAEQVSISVISELIEPLHPVTSWFKDAPSKGIASNSPSISPRPKSGAAAQAIKVTTNNNIARSPLKSPACKRCPALNNGLCKCAVKQFKLSA